MHERIASFVWVGVPYFFKRSDAFHRQHSKASMGQRRSQFEKEPEMKMPTAEEVEKQAKCIYIAVEKEVADDIANSLSHFATLLRDPEIAMLLRLRESGDWTPETDAIKVDTGLPQLEYYVALAGQYETLARSLEKKLALAVAALKDIRTADDDCVCDSGYSANTVAIETIAQIEEKK